MEFDIKTYYNCNKEKHLVCMVTRRIFELGYIPFKNDIICVLNELNESITIGDYICYNEKLNTFIIVDGLKFHNSFYEKENLDLSIKPVMLGKYIHYKGGSVVVTGSVINEYDNTQMVTYVDTYRSNLHWCRKYDEFFGEVTKGIRRFVKVDDSFI